MRYSDRLKQISRYSELCTQSPDTCCSHPNGEESYSDGYDERGRQIQRSIYGATKKETAEELNTILVQKTKWNLCHAFKHTSEGLAD